MEPETRTPLTSLDLCVLIAHETAAMLDSDAEALDTAAQLREGLVLLAAANGLDEQASPLLTWIDQEVDNAKQFTATGKDTPHLIDLERLLPVPDAAVQLDAVWMIFRTTLGCTKEQRNALFLVARTLTEMGGLEDMLLTTKVPNVGFLTAEALRAELKDVRTAIHTQVAQSVEQPLQL